MNKFQNLNFRSVDEFLEHLPREELEVVTRLREIIDNIFPRYLEKLAYNVPFYYNNRRICFIWPSSISWGNLEDGVALGFAHGRTIDPNGELLQWEHRKTLGRVILKSLDDAVSLEAEIRYLLQEAYMLDRKKG